MYKHVKFSEIIPIPGSSMQLMKSDDGRWFRGIAVLGGKIELTPIRDWDYSKVIPSTDNLIVYEGDQPFFYHIDREQITPLVKGADYIYSNSCVSLYRDGDRYYTEAATGQNHAIPVDGQVFPFRFCASRQLLQLAINTDKLAIGDFCIRSGIFKRFIETDHTGIGQIIGVEMDCIEPKKILTDIGDLAI